MSCCSTIVYRNRCLAALSVMSNNFAVDKECIVAKAYFEIEVVQEIKADDRVQNISNYRPTVPLKGTIAQTKSKSQIPMRLNWCLACSDELIRALLVMGSIDVGLWKCCRLVLSINKNVEPTKDYLVWSMEIL